VIEKAQNIIENMTEIFAGQLNLEKKANGSWFFAYGFLAGREKLFFDDSQLQQLLHTNSQTEFLNLIQNANYLGETVEEALINSQQADLELIYSIVPDYTLLKIFLLFNDAHNLKVFLRTILPAQESILIKDIEYLLLRPYLTEPQQILSAVRNMSENTKKANNANNNNTNNNNDNNNNINNTELTEESNSMNFQVPEWFQPTIKQAEEIYLESYDMSRVDLVVNQALWQEIIDLLSDINSEWLTEYYLLKVDLINLEILFRCRNLNLNKDFFQRSLLLQGNLNQEQWLELFSLDDSELSKKLDFFGFGDFSETMGSYYQPGSASIFSQLADSHLMKKIRETKSFASGVEKVAAYYLIREMERRNIRLIRACHLNSIPQERAGQMIRPSYVGV